LNIWLQQHIIETIRWFRLVWDWHGDSWHWNLQSHMTEETIKIDVGLTLDLWQRNPKMLTRNIDKMLIYGSEDRFFHISLDHPQTMYTFLYYERSAFLFVRKQDCPCMNTDMLPYYNRRTGKIIKKNYFKSSFVSCLICRYVK